MHTFANCHAMPARQDLVGLHSILVYKKLFWPNLTVFANPSRDFATTPPVGALGTLNRSVSQPYHLEVDTDYRSTQMSKWEENQETEFWKITLCLFIRDLRISTNYYKQRLSVSLLMRDPMITTLSRLDKHRSAQWGHCQPMQNFHNQPFPTCQHALSNIYSMNWHNC